MNPISRRVLALAGLALALSSVSACRPHTQLSAVTKDPTYDPLVMRRVFVVAVVKSDRGQQMLENEFVRQLTSSGREATASYTLVPHDTKLEEEAWKSLIASHGFDTVVISRLLDMEVVEKETRAKVVPNINVGSGYGYYGSAYGSAYQPSSYVREQTATIETKVFDVTRSKEVWSAQSKTPIVWGGDPEPQVRRFVATLINAARNPKSGN